MNAITSMSELRSAIPPFFAPDAMAFFQSRVCEKVYPLPAANKSLFISSEQIVPRKPRVYSVRVVDWLTKEHTVLGEFGAFADMRGAKAFCEWMVAGCGWMPNDTRLGARGTEAWRDGAGVLRVRYYDTVIVTAEPDDGPIVLDNGGFFTMTTKTRMTQAANQYGLGYSIKQVQGTWVVEKDGAVYTFDKRGKCKIGA